MKPIQNHPGSLILRHTEATAYVVDQLRGRAEPPRILCFGCSWGAEIIGFALALPHARIVGVDVDAKALRHASDIFAASDNVEIHPSNWDTIERFGPYDAITCNAVLCRYPASNKTNDISSVFPF